MQALPAPASALALALLAACSSPPPAPAPTPQPPRDPWLHDPGAVVRDAIAEAGVAPIELLLLGTFHFDDKGLDEYEPTHGFDPLDAERQQQIARVVDDLVAFAPDVVCVERHPRVQERLDARYTAYRSGELTDRPDEIVQIAFRLADRLGHERVHGIDANGRGPEPTIAPVEWATTNGKTDVIRRMQTPLREVQAKYLAARDRFIDRADLSSIYRFANHPDVLAVSHATYLVGTFHAADGETFPGPDGFVTRWHNRNLRIFDNIHRVARPGQRVLVLIGTGHVPILRHCARCSPEFELVEVADVIEKTAR